MEYVIDNIVHIFISIFDLYVIYRFMSIFFRNNVINKRAAILIYLFRYVLSEAVTLFIPYPLANLIAAVLSLFMITFCYKSELSKKIITTVIIYMLSFVSEALVALLIGVSNFSVFEKSNNGNNMALIIAEIILWAMTLIVRKFKNVRANVPIPKAFTIALIAVPISSIFLEMLVFEQEHVNNRIATTSLICVITLNFIMVYLYDSLSKMFEEKTQAEIIRREKAYYHEQSELLQKSYEELRHFRHDIKNRMLVIMQMANNNDTDKIKSYVSQAASKLENTTMYSKTGNIAIDSIINYKLARAREYGIDIKSNISVPPNIEIEDDDVVIILGNLLDNAIEAVEKLQNNKYINVNVEYEKDGVFICIKNSYDNIVNIENGEIKTSKDDIILHGIGLKSVRACIEKYKGTIDIDYSNNEFIVDVILYL